MSNCSSNFSFQLSKMDSLAELFQLFLAGKHLNRPSDPLLWKKLEEHEDSYRSLFAALGYELRIDPRGFAWFHVDEMSSNNKTSRRLALLFMLIFDYQANAGKSLQRFHEWSLDQALMDELYQENRELLDAENLNPEGLLGVLKNSANRLGFVKEDGPVWRLLPAVKRYLDHIEALNKELVETTSAERSAWTPEEYM